MENTLSVTGKIWKMRLDDDTKGFALAQKIAESELVGRLLAGRSIDTAQDALTYLSPKLSDLPDPSHLLDMDKAVARLKEALEKEHKIAIFGDYDVDGACASALLIRYFKALGVETLLYIPDRTLEGYGPNPEAMEKLKKMGADVVITVDCGSVAFEPMARAKELGLDVIITDHHQTVPEIPSCVALLNPNRVDETSECTMLSGAGVAFYLAMALNRELRESNYFQQKNISVPDLRYLLDLVAVSTVCDMVPLTGPNRPLVRLGFQSLSMQKNDGLVALLNVAGVNEKAGTYHAGFVIGPRINAGGRISECDLGAKLLSTTSNHEAMQIAQRLDLLNEERKAIEQQVLEEAMQQAQEQFKETDNSIVLARKGWHPGVIGIVASRIKEKFHRPTFIISVDEKGECKGSGRSISGIDLGAAVIACKNAGVISKGGGHKMAAGVSLEFSALDDFKNKMEEFVSAQKNKAGKDIFQKSIMLDGFISPETVNVSFMNLLEKLEPFGVSNPEPRFVLSGVRLAFAKPVGADGTHLTFSVQSRTGKPLKGIAFSAMENEIGPAMMKAVKTKEALSLCGTIRKNVYLGVESYQLQLQDMMKGSFEA